MQVRIIDGEAASRLMEPLTALVVQAGEVHGLRAGTLKLPHIGWNDVAFSGDHAMTRRLPARECGMTRRRQWLRRSGMTACCPRWRRQW